jgi:hypothetical protein
LKLHPLQRRVNILLGRPEDVKKVLEQFLTDSIACYRCYRFDASSHDPESHDPEPVARFQFYKAIIEANINKVVLLDATCLYPPYTKKIAELIAKDAGKQYIIVTYDEHLLVPLIEKTKAGDLAVYVARDDGTIKLDPEKVLEVEDIFFNLDKL